MTSAATGYRFSDGAAEDLFALVDSYNARRERLGDELFDLVLLKVEQSIVPWPGMHGRHRRAPSVHIYRLKRFPVRLLYRVKDDTVHVVAVEHMHEEPDKWRGRLIEPDDDE